jgi:hypothetical protein
VPSGGGLHQRCGVQDLRREDTHAPASAGADCGDGQSLCPQGQRVKELIERQGVASCFVLPPYSPDFNPIEEAFAKIKGILRKAEARTREALVEAMGSAISAIDPQDARGFFDHCGYDTQVQPL